jgi:hypothetical protein
MWLFSSAKPDSGGEIAGPLAAGVYETYIVD